MRIKQLLLTAAAAAILTTTGAMARDRDGRPDHSWSEQHDRDGYRDRDRGHDGARDFRGHDRYWRDGYRDYAHRDVFYRSLRAHHYDRWQGEPYWFNGRYVIRTYDRFGRVVFVEMNPYTGGFMGEFRF
jgi:Ni/Co efflux regulator RcnB